MAKKLHLSSPVKGNRKGHSTIYLTGPVCQTLERGIFKTLSILQSFILTLPMGERHNPPQTKPTEWKGHRHRKPQNLSVKFNVLSKYIWRNELRFSTYIFPNIPNHPTGHICPFNPTSTQSMYICKIGN